MLDSAGLTWRREEGTRCFIRLRRDDVDPRVPALLDTVLGAADRDDVGGHVTASGKPAAAC
jgi:hypothetical protein